MTLALAIARAVHAKRPALRARSGGDMLRTLIEQIGSDAVQMATVEPFERGGSRVTDVESTKAQRFLLRCLEATKEGRAR